MRKLYKNILMNYFEGIQKDLHRSVSFQEDAKNQLQSICGSIIYEMAKEKAIPGVVPAFLTVHTLSYALPLILKYESSEMGLYDYVMFICDRTMNSVIKWQTCDPSCIEDGIRKYGPIFEILPPIEKDALMSGSENWFLVQARAHAQEMLKLEINPALLAD